jgi:SAM-dependent methyltransferase
MRVLKEERLARFASLGTNVVAHDLRRGIPAATNSIDAVYHSHLLEHIDRKYVRGFLAEVWRVLKPGGIHRIAVPDWERLCRDYLNDVDRSRRDPTAREHHDSYIALMIDQMVRSEATGTSQQGPIQRALENLILGDAKRRGELHRWMYDRISLECALQAAGFPNVEVVDFMQSSIPDWTAIGLDVGVDGREYKPESLYVEAVKPTLGDQTMGASAQRHSGH